MINANVLSPIKNPNVMNGLRGQRSFYNSNIKLKNCKIKGMYFL